MKRRQFMKVAGTGVAAAVIAKPAIAQSMPEIKWRLTSSFPKSLDTIYGTSEVFAKQVAEMTDNKFQIQVFAAGEIVPGLQALDATSNGTVEMCCTCCYYYVGKDPTFAIATVAPFGLNSRQQTAWMVSGGGEAAWNEFFKNYNVTGMCAGNTGANMGGWFRKEIKSLADVKGLKMRVSGLAGMVWAKLGAVPQQLAAGDIYPALEKGTIDAVEWVGPHDDEKLGFVKVAPYYYYPSWWEGNAVIHNLINLDKYNALPKSYQAILYNASMNANAVMQAKYDIQNPAALKRLIAAGAQLKPFPLDTLDAAYKATNELYAEISAKNENFKKYIGLMKATQNDQYLWWQLAEYTFDGFMIRQRGRN